MGEDKTKTGQERNKEKRRGKKKEKMINDAEVSKNVEKTGRENGKE